jgi:hypothetical protein
MDGSSFDKLSVDVHRLREQASRRGALRLLLGGSLILAVPGLVAEAHNKKHKNKNKKNCGKWGNNCNKHNKHNNRCFYGYCWNWGGGGGGGGGNCGSQYCQNGWGCHNQGGVHVCVPDNYGNYCGNNTYYGNDYNCCHGNYGAGCHSGGDCCGGAGLCCQSGWKCCSGSTCIPHGWDCNDFYRQSADAGIESADRIPSMAPASVPESDYFVATPVE